MWKFVLVFVLVVFFTILINNGPGGIENFTCSGGVDHRFPVYQRQGWSYTDAISPPDFSHRIRGPGPLDGYVDSGVQRWADFQGRLNSLEGLRKNHCGVALNYETGF